MCGEKGESRRVQAEEMGLGIQRRWKEGESYT